MKKNTNNLILLKHLIQLTCFFIFSLISVISFSCSYEEVVIYSPVYMSYEEMRSPVKSVIEPQEVTNAGKIYYYDPYLLINEVEKGIHFYDNTNPSTPVYLGMVAIIGNIDMAVRDGVLYADNYVDLLALDISGLPDLNTVTTLKRLEKVLYFVSSAGRDDSDLNQTTYSENIDDSKGVVIRWDRKVETRITSDMQTGYMRGFGGMMATDAMAENVQTGQGGSMAKFTIYKNFLYTIVGEKALQLFNIEIPANPVLFSNINIGINIETIYPYAEKELLFIGAQNGMYIYSVEDPSNPQFKSRFLHVRSFDPVVAQGDFAYVTLRAGNWNGSQNELEVIDISNIIKPELKKTVSMQGPYGLGILNNSLFVCDGTAGLKLYDISKIPDVTFIKQIGDFETYDVIPVSASLIMVTGPEELRQYSIDTSNDLNQLSTITIKK
ncbi:MAG: hypothetical protein A2015_06570 [Spirochaetes bacterium GWF1_31_7]|nr:MAG: hypothetical protein A2Y30_08405 [Spirochaetes bacterium GWE1_32_154]OHD51409.1 MAG: hypothetical protein A2Y29_14790 [Spirochaetes bacterium GWE2_31_10]OHD53135.1 MAG: hypothetical protein A2015_06570 [Spirochaetes bacterium GWF1_31_7]OHD83017.1 MAG: hypothetical protein A2355_14745 [Spirochaetes bacterium RIFOXYB1_FULL_32_8]